jgi:FkbM family methyltransferase
MRSGFSASRWKRWAGALVISALLPVGAIIAADALTPVRTARAVLRLNELWAREWPLARGKYIPVRLNELLFDVGVLHPVEAEVQGFVMELDSRDLVTQTLLSTGVWEPESTEVVQTLQEGGIFIDVGAHVGYYSLVASKRVGNTGRVISIEPNPRTADRLRRNIRLNNAKNLLVQEVACTDTEKTLNFFQAGVENTGSSSFSVKNARSKPEIQVRGVPLDLIVKTLNLPRIDLVKIDVEGAELQVLRGMEESLPRFRPKLIVELEEENLENLGTSAKEVYEFFRAHGYAVQRHLDTYNYLWAPM